MNSKPTPVHTSPSSPTPTKSSRFRFKSKDPYPILPTESPPYTKPHSSRPHRHRHHHRSKRRHSSPSQPPLSPNTSFRESLFDALAEDEGAAFWEGVYGQPIHIYSPYDARRNTDDANGELEKMDDEEYVAYVRSKMWEKTHEHALEERKRREESRQKRRKRDEEGRKWEKGVEEALKRGEDRRRKWRWKASWERYVKAWDGGGIEPSKTLTDQDIWPVESGTWQDVSKSSISEFFTHAPQPTTAGAVVNLHAILKAERVKWHPDKMQQRFGRPSGIDEGSMKTVTAVFQVVDWMWGETREV